MKKAFIASLVAAQVTLIVGIVLIVWSQSQSQALVNRELEELRTAMARQDERILQQDRNHLATAKLMDEHSADLKTISEETARLSSREDGKMESISTRIAEKPVLQPLRWAYVDKFKLLRLVQAQTKTEGMTPKQKQENSTAHIEIISRAIREFAEGKFDLILDKTFGDHHVHYRAARPALDVTDSVEQVLREIQARQ